MAKRKDLRDQTYVPAPAAERPAPEPAPPPPPHAEAPPAEAVASAPAEAQSGRTDRPPTRRPRARGFSAPLDGPPFKLRFWPMFTVAVMTIVLMRAPGLIVDFVSDHVGLPVYGYEALLTYNFANQTVMLLLALGGIWFLRRRMKIDFGLHMPRGRSYVATAIILGIFFGVVMTLVDYGGNLIGHKAPGQFAYGYNPTNIAGWLLFQGLYVGPTTEIPFRSLLVTYLTARLPGRIRYRGFEMNGAGVAVAAMFAIAYGLYALIAKPFLVGIGQTAYIFLGGIALAYWLEKSGSILAPVVGHNVAAVVEQALVFAMVGAWRE